MNLFKELYLTRHNSKGLFFLLFFRISSFFSRNSLLRLIGFPIRLIYKIIIQWILGIDIPDKTRIGSLINIYHGIGLIVHEKVIIGKNVVLRHNTTIGNAKRVDDVPTIKDNVQIGANCVIIGDIVIGNNSVIAAGSVVVKSVPDFCIVAGNPAKIIKEIIKS